MKVHLVRSGQFSANTFKSVLQILNQFQGPVSYVASETDLELENAIEVEIARKEDFEWADSMSFSMYSISPAMAEEKSFPLKQKQASWDDFFKLCEAYRQKHKIDPSEPVILLTDVANDANWFGGIDESMKNVFIHTADWDYYFEGINERFPISYEVVAWVCRMLSCNNRSEFEKNMHLESVGCMSDFCQEKKQIVLKMRTADICASCFDFIQRSGIDVRVLRQVIDSMEGIRKNFLTTERSAFLDRPSRIEIKGYMYQIFLPDYGSLEIMLNPKQRAIYCFYLNHPEGVRLVDLVDHRREISDYYHRFSNFGNNQEIEAAIDLLLDPTDNNINEVLSRIKRVFVHTLGPRLASQYLITGNRGEPYRINIPRDLISFQEVP